MLSKKSKYAIKALAYLASRHGQGPILIAEIAESKKIPVKFLESILLELRKAGFLGSKKGKGGGYFFEQDPSTIKLASIIRIVNGPISILPCVSLYFYKHCEDCDETNCSLHNLAKEVRDATLGILEHRTVNDLREEHPSGLQDIVENPCF